jgi:methionyl-tRNA formyltransferase
MVEVSGPRIVFAGSVSSSRRTLQGLLRHRANVVGVLGLSLKAAHNVSGYVRLDDLARAANIPYLDFDKINAPEIITAIRTWQPDLLFIVGLSQLVDNELLSVPTKGCIGFHPTWLPEGRGRAPIAWLVLDGRPGAATFFLMEQGVDSGPILVQEPVYVSSRDYAADVIEKLENAIDVALDRWLPRLIAGEWNPIPQDESLATYNGRRAPTDGLIDWRLPAEQIHALIRATSHPHPGAYTYLKDRKLIVWRSSLGPKLAYRGVIGRILYVDANYGWLVQTGDGLIWLSEVEFADTMDKDPQLELRVGMRLGYVVEDEIYGLKRQLERMEDIITRLCHGTMEPKVK